MMKFFAHFFFFFFTFTLLLFYSFTPAFASAEFATDYKITYEATIDGKLRINQDVALTNKLSNVYATEYSFTLEKGKPLNITASDGQGPIEVKTLTEDNKTTLNLHFNEQVVGRDKTLKFNLKYELSELLHHSGQVWEIALPKVVKAEEIENYHLTLKVPLGFGKPAFISPTPANQKSEDQTQFFFFEKEQIVNTGVVAAFGQFQVFDFQLAYHLTNPAGKNVLMKIALPPDTSYQKVSYEQITPEPGNVEVDLDGNWLAVYRLGPSEKKDVVAAGQAKIFAQPQTDFVPEAILMGNLTQSLSAQKYWEKTDQKIVDLAQKLKTPQKIYDYVIKTLDYDYSRVRSGAKRLGAQEVLSQPDRAICMEYTDLFVALARAAGIPARELDGFAYTNNPVLQPLSLVQDVLHAWPEYWDRERRIWIQVDPTWQDTTGGVDYFTKLDVGHFAFVIHGENSQSPYPAGSYKEESYNKKDVVIAFGQYKEPSPKVIKADFLLPQNIIAERETEGKIAVENQGNQAIYNLKISLASEHLTLLSESETTLATLPPFARQEIPVRLKVEKFFPKGQGKLVLLGNNQKFEYNLSYESIILNKILPAFGGLLVAAVLSIIAKKAWRLYLQRKAG